jgi:hypothetical protein
MSTTRDDDATAAKPEPTPEPAATEKPAEPTMFGLPLMSFVKGGTSTSAHDKEVAGWRADDEKRRAEQDVQRKIASVPIEQGGAKMFSQQTGSPQDTAKVLLDYVNEAGEALILETKPIQCLADIIAGMNHSDPTDLAVVLLCPFCWNKGLPAGRCQMHALQSNRRWHLDSRTEGELIIFEGQPYRSAGKIMDSEPMTCGCGWRFRIHNNKVRTERK